MVVTDDKWVNRESVLEAVEDDGLALQYASKELRSDREIVFKAVKDRGEALQYASDRIRADREIVLAAVQSPDTDYIADTVDLDEPLEVPRGSPLRYAAEHLKDDREIVLSAINYSADAYRIASRNVQADSEVFITAAVARIEQYHLLEESLLDPIVPAFEWEFYESPAFFEFLTQFFNALPKDYRYFEHYSEYFYHRILGMFSDWALLCRGLTETDWAINFIPEDLCGDTTHLGDELVEVWSELDDLNIKEKTLDNAKNDMLYFSGGGSVIWAFFTLLLSPFLLGLIYFWIGVLEKFNERWFLAYAIPGIALCTYVGLKATMISKSRGSKKLDEQQAAERQSINQRRASLEKRFDDLNQQIDDETGIINRKFLLTAIENGFVDVVNFATEELKKHPLIAPHVSPNWSLAHLTIPQPHPYWVRRKPRKA